MNLYAKALENAWDQLLSWHREGKFVPRSEEDIQCFLYHGLVMQLGTARGICPKHTTGKDAKLSFHKGKLLTGNMHFPDLLLGPADGEAEVAVEIKFKRSSRANIFPGCIADVEKLGKHHGPRLQYFILFDEHPTYAFWDDHQFQVLRTAASSRCKFLWFPAEFNPSPLKKIARDAVQKQRAAGANFRDRGKANAKKAMFGTATPPVDD